MKGELALMRLFLRFERRGTRIILAWSLASLAIPTFLVATLDTPAGLLADLFN